MNMKSVILVILTILCLGATIGMWFVVNKSEPEYTEVEATIVSAESKTVRTKYSTNIEYDVKVEYNGEEYKLNNAHTAVYYTGQAITAYMANGKLYADVAGVKSSTPIAIVYYVFLVATVGLFIYTPTYMSKAKKQRQAAA